MIKISSIMLTLLTTASIVWDATSRTRTGAAQIPPPGTSLYAHGVASMSTTHGVAHKIKTGQNLGGGRVSVKTAGESQNPVEDATLSTAGSLGQNVGGGRVRFKTVGVGQGAGGGATLGAVSSWGQGAGGGRVQVKTVAVGQDKGRDASLGTADDVWQGLGGGRVRVKTVGVHQSLGRVANHGTVDDEIADGGARYGGSEDLATNRSTPLIEARWRSANGLFTVKSIPMEIEESFEHSPPKCDSSGFGYSTTSNTYGCVCNFAGACNWDGIPVKEAQFNMHYLKGFAPKGIEEFRYKKNGQLVTICEKNTVGILFDCDGRIPLYAATVIDGANLKGKSSRNDKWRGTWDDKLERVEKLYVGGNKDYEKSSCIVYCYKDGKSQTFQDWYGRPCTDGSTTIPDVTGIDRGHMIAARYGNGHRLNLGVEATFTYTNAVPQIASFNRGAWAQGEDIVMEFAKRCHEAATGGKVYVVVGAIPMTFFGMPRFFGEGRFSNVQDDKRRISVPLIMWTAACCIDNEGSYLGNFAFYGWNLKFDQKVERFDSASKMFKAMNTTGVLSETIPIIEVFPGIKNCN